MWIKNFYSGHGGTHLKGIDKQISEFAVILVYTGNLRTAKATRRNFVSNMMQKENHPDVGSSQGISSQIHIKIYKNVR